jgi:hypothetical protein
LLRVGPTNAQALAIVVWHELSIVVRAVVLCYFAVTQ